MWKVEIIIVFHSNYLKGTQRERWQARWSHLLPLLPLPLLTTSGGWSQVCPAAASALTAASRGLLQQKLEWRAELRTLKRNNTPANGGYIRVAQHNGGVCSFSTWPLAARNNSIQLTKLTSLGSVLLIFLWEATSLPSWSFLSSFVPVFTLNTSLAVISFRLQHHDKEVQQNFS